MMGKGLYTAGILGTGSYLPETKFTNKDLENMVDTSDEWITSRTGIKERRITDSKTACSDLAAKAAINALNDCNMSASQLDLIIVSTVTPDMMFPSTACLVQQKIGATRAAAFDIEAACSGFMYSISVAKQFIEGGVYENILVIGSETLSKITDWSDRKTCVLFGDGAGAAVVSRVQQGYGIMSVKLGADGSGADLLRMEAGGSKNPASIMTVKNRMHYIKMEGKQVFKFAVKTMERAARDVLSQCEMDVDDVDIFIPHQANMRIIDLAARKMNINKERIFTNIQKYGNISSASIPVSLDQACKLGRIKNGDNVLLVAFGGGLTWGSCLIKWSKHDIGEEII